MWANVAQQDTASKTSIFKEPTTANAKLDIGTEREPRLHLAEVFRPLSLRGSEDGLEL